jgi:hypothetical protein
MSRKRHTPEQIIGKLREAEVGLASGQTMCLLLIPSAAEILGFQIDGSRCEQSVRVRQTLAKSLRC